MLSACIYDKPVLHVLYRSGRSGEGIYLRDVCASFPSLTTTSGTAVRACVCLCVVSCGGSRM